jgi:hypothetical protein
VSHENPEPEPFTLNPLYLKAAVEEARSPLKPEPIASANHRQEAAKPPPPSSLNQAKSMEKEPARTDDLTQHPRKPASPIETSKAAIKAKWAEVAKIREEIDRLSKIKDSQPPDDPNTYQMELNELRLKRLAIQMALISDSKEYDDNDILNLDKQIAECVQKIAQTRKPGPASNGMAAELLARIEGLRAEEESLASELKKLLATHNQWLAVRKAKDYIHALKAAHHLQLELLALASLGADDGPLRNLDFGGELPRPRGFEIFASILPWDLAITDEGIEEAKARIRSEIGL